MRCPKCTGCIIDSYDDRYCINCAMRFHAPDAPPIVIEEAWRWLSVLCAKCHDRSAIRGHVLCRGCWNKKKVDHLVDANKKVDNGKEKS